MFSSARDRLGRQTVAIKKLADPFRSDNIAKHMFREVKLLEQLQHENVGIATALLISNELIYIQLIHLKDIFISPSEDVYEPFLL